MTYETDDTATAHSAALDALLEAWYNRAYMLADPDFNLDTMFETAQDQVVEMRDLVIAANVLLDKNLKASKDSFNEGELPRLHVVFEAVRRASPIAGDDNFVDAARSPLGGDND